MEADARLMLILFLYSLPYFPRLKNVFVDILAKLLSKLLAS